MQLRLLASQRFHRVFPAGGAGGDEAGQEREEHADGHQDDGGLPRQRGHVRHVEQRVDDGVGGYAGQHGQADADDAGREAHDDGLGVEHAADVALAGADGAQDADLLLAFQHRNVGDDADHDGRHHQRDGHERHQHVADHVHDVGDRGHERAHEVGVGDHLVVFAVGGHAVVVGVEDADDLLFALEVDGVDVDAARLVEVGVAQLLQVVVVGGVLLAHHRHHELGEVVLVHVHLERVGEGRLIDAHGVRHVRGDLVHGLLHGSGHLRFQRGLHLLHVRAQHVLHVRAHGRGDGRLQLALKRLRHGGDGLLHLCRQLLL